MIKLLVGLLFLVWLINEFGKGAWNITDDFRWEDEDEDDYL